MEEVKEECVQPGQPKGDPERASEAGVCTCACVLAVFPAEDGMRLSGAWRRTSYPPTPALLPPMLVASVGWLVCSVTPVDPLGTGMSSPTKAAHALPSAMESGTGSGKHPAACLQHAGQEAIRVPPRGCEDIGGLCWLSGCTFPGHSSRPWCQEDTCKRETAPRAALSRARPDGALEAGWWVVCGPGKHGLVAGIQE